MKTALSGTTILSCGVCAKTDQFSTNGVLVLLEGICAVVKGKEIFPLASAVINPETGEPNSSRS